MKLINSIDAPLLLILISLLLSCNNQSDVTISNIANTVDQNIDTETQMLVKLPDKKDSIYHEGKINVLVEIPAGTNQKWELDKTDRILKWEKVEEELRIVKYLGYPGNYGMIPGTLLPKELGGDGDPLDVLVLGAPAKRGSLIKCKIIGVLYLSDRGEQDDKLIAVLDDSPFESVNDIVELNKKFKGVSQIIETWFLNYKGPDKMTSNGFGTKIQAEKILHNSILK
jgi:inorganic pyrophosphatase